MKTKTKRKFQNFHAVHPYSPKKKHKNQFKIKSNPMTETKRSMNQKPATVTGESSSLAWIWSGFRPTRPSWTLWQSEQAIWTTLTATSSSIPYSPATSIRCNPNPTRGSRPRECETSLDKGGQGGEGGECEGEEGSTLRFGCDEEQQKRRNPAPRAPALLLVVVMWNDEVSLSIIWFISFNDFKGNN